MTTRLDIAIVGFGALFPGRGTTLGYWRDIVEGVDALSPVPASHWLVEDYYDADPLTRDRTYGNRGGFISPVPFEPMSFGIPPSAIAATDTSQLLALMVAHGVLADIEAATGGRIDRARTSCILGVASATELVGHMSGRLQRPVWINALREAGLPEPEVQAIAARMEAHYTGWNEASFPGMLGNVVAGRIANRLDLGGSNYVTDAACASSLAAVRGAVQELVTGDSDTVLCGGVDALNDILMYMCFSKTPALSPTGDCRPFSDKADGTMLGEGIGILALRRLADAEADGNRIHAVIRGIGGGSDGRATAIYAPLPDGQARTLRRAYDQAGYRPRTVTLVEAHGTGTKAGDAAEIKGLKRAFDPDGEAEAPWCAIGSVKSQIGHTKAAAGAASLIKAVLALSRRTLPPTAKVDAPAAALAGSPFYVNTQPRPWISADGHPRRASVSSFGFGGSNFHVTLEEYPAQVEAPRIHPAELVLLGAASETALADALEALASGLQQDGDLARQASASHAAFDDTAPARLSLVAASEADAADKALRLAALLRSGRAGSAPLPPHCALERGPARPGRLALLFPGQGSQHVGMGRELALAFPAAREAWDMAARHPATGPMRLHDLAFPPAAFTPEEAAAQSARLTALTNAQPAIAAATLAHLAVIGALGLSPAAAAGHSFGEVMALHAAGAFDAAAALTIARTRAACMNDAAGNTDGAMLAVQAGADAIAPFLEGQSGVVLANDNAPAQIVLSGPTDAVLNLQARLTSAGFRCHRLPVASAFHSAVVASACAPFGAALSQIAMAAPAFPVYAGAIAAPYDGADIAARLASQIGEPVRFRETITAMADAGCTTFLEVGPGNIVATLARQCLEGRPVRILSTDQKGEGGLAAFLAAVGRLALWGHRPDLAALYDGQPAPDAPALPSRHAVWISGANHGKPYPPAEGAAGRAPPNPENAGRAPLSAPAAPASRPEETEDVSDTTRIYTELAARHGEFLATMNAAHTQFLNMTARLLGDASPALPAVMPAPTPAPMPSPVTAPTPPAAPAPTPPVAAVTPVAPAPAAPIRPAMPSPDSAPSALATVTQIVADKTGYPTDMLAPDMDLESELGVDSIKQVEILSTLRERLPSLPEIAPERLGDLRTIAQIAAFIGGPAVSASAPAPAPVVIPAPAARVAPAPAAAPASSGDLAALVRTLIADKTGYPEDMLEDDMDLESELGVDSIKQVEILSALREARTDLPDIDPSQVAELRSIRKIADFFA